jgi:glycerate kinase
MKIVIAPDSFKGSATSIEVATWIENGIHAVFPEYETIKIPIGDGGEGSLDAVLHAGFVEHSCEVTGPVGNRVTARFGMRKRTAFIEMAQASGLSHLPHGKLNALDATTFGTGEIILRALDAGATQIILAVGGSACTDAGAGALQALGAQLRNSKGEEIPQGGRALSDCVSIDLSKLDPRLAEVKFTLASDVSNPLLGKDGAARIFAPQKGASPSDVETLEQSLTHFASIVGGEYASLPGAGAAGGFGFMAFAFLHATAESGIEFILDLVGFKKHLHDADFVITGEGRFDSQSSRGKAPWGIMLESKKLGIPTFLLCGAVEGYNPSEFKEVFTLNSLEPDLRVCMQNPAPLVSTLSANIAKLIQQL